MHKINLLTIAVLVVGVSCSSIEPHREIQESPAQTQIDPFEFIKRCVTAPNHLRALETLTLEVAEILDDLKVTYWLEGGTLLGAYRFRSHMPFDDDADFGVLKEELDRNMNTLKSRLAANGHSIHNLGENLHWQIRTGKEPFVFLDLFPFETFPGKDDYLRLSGSYWNRAARLEFPRNIIFDAHGKLGTVKLLGKQLNVPVNIEAYLARWYPESNILTSFIISSPHGGSILI